MTPSPIRDAIVALLQQHGPMHYLQIAEALEGCYSSRQIRGSIGNARVNHPGQIFRVVKWLAKGQCGEYPLMSHWTAVYESQAGADAPKPVLGERQKRAQQRKRAARWQEKNRGLVRAKARAKYQAKRGYATLNPWASLISSGRA